MDENYDYSDVLNDSNFWRDRQWSDDDLNNLDTSDFNFPNKLWHVKSPQEIVIKTILMLTVGVTGLYLNFVILLIIARNRWLWSASTFLIGNLAFVDFLVLLFCPWFTLVSEFYQNYMLNNFGCRFEGFLQASLLLANVGSVILVSYDRLAAAVLTSEARVTRSCAPKLVVLNFFMAIAISLPWIINTEYIERQWLNHLEKFCTEDPQVLGIYWHFALMLLVWIPLGVMVVIYGAIMWRLECTARKLSSRGGGQIVSRAKGRAMRVTACVLIAAVVCRIPYSVMVYWRDNNEMYINSVNGPFEVIWFMAHFLMYVNCAINPLIYGFTNTRFRKAMDRTPGISCCKFGSWCCICVTFKKKQVELEDKNTERIFVIESSPRPNKKLSKIIKSVLHINKDTIDLSLPKVDDVTAKPTRVTPLKTEIF